MMEPPGAVAPLFLILKIFNDAAMVDFMPDGLGIGMIPPRLFNFFWSVEKHRLFGNSR
jgi:hypothetical protein